MTRHESVTSHQIDKTESGLPLAIAKYFSLWSPFLQYVEVSYERLKLNKYYIYKV